MCDKGIVAILGTTYTGHFYDVEELNAAVEAKNKQTGWQLSIHVDGASGGFVAPFLYPDLKCECQSARAGHKLVVPVCPHNASLFLIT